MKAWYRLDSIMMYGFSNDGNLSTCKIAAGWKQHKFYSIKNTMVNSPQFTEAKLFHSIHHRTQSEISHHVTWSFSYNYLNPVHICHDWVHCVVWWCGSGNIKQDTGWAGHHGEIVLATLYTTNTKLGQYWLNTAETWEGIASKNNNIDTQTTNTVGLVSVLWSKMYLSLMQIKIAIKLGNKSTLISAKKSSLVNNDTHTSWLTIVDLNKSWSSYEISTMDESTIFQHILLTIT